VLDISRIEAGRFELHEERITVAKAVQEAVALVKMQSDAKSIALAVDPGRGDMTLTADRRALHQILVNLLSNAVKFTPDGGHVAITVRRGGSGELVIQVSDSGIGIDADSLERVFGPFERVGAPETREVEGTGLGLPITRGLVELHGGVISLASERGRGTVATVVIPAARVDSTDVRARAA
jgi:two-component system, cell cycle sensor histidine kinase PleC